MELNPARNFEEDLLQRAMGRIFGLSFGVMIPPETRAVNSRMFLSPYSSGIIELIGFCGIVLLSLPFVTFKIIGERHG